MAPTPAAQPAAAPNEPFAYRRVAIDSSRPEAEACLAFNKPLATGDVKYADYVRISPEVKSALRVVDDRLCIGGLTYGQDYTVRMLAGFPGSDGAKLSDEMKVDVALGARPAVVTLPGKGFILPRGTTAGLPITTINVSKVGIEVYRVNERAIDRFANDRYDASFPGSEPITESWSLRGWLNGTNGVRQWRGTMEVRSPPNQPVVTAFPIRETIKDWKPGAYFVVVWNAAKPPSRSYDDDDDDSSGGSAAGMWVMDTDIALTSFTGQDGLNVFARSLQSAQPLAGLELVLLTRGNEPVAKAITAADGRVNFAAGLLKGRGAAEAFAVMASDASKQEFARLELSKAAFDFSDRGISGRDQPGPVDAFLYTERGVYRPGETVQLMAMLRDNGAVALANMPVTLIVKRPDGTEFTRFTHALQASGALYQPIDLPKSSRRGRWSVNAHIDPKAAPVGRVEFSVEDFVPEKLKVELTPDQPILRPGQVNSFAVSADFLYGAPASGLTVEADMRVTVDRPAVRRLRQILVRIGKRAQEVRAALHHAHRARYRRRPASRASNGAATRSRTRCCRCAPSSRPACSSPAAAAPRAPTRRCRCAPATSISASVRPSRAATPARVLSPSSTSWRSTPPASRSPGRRWNTASSASTTPISGTRSTANGAGSRTQNERLLTTDTLALKADQPTRLSRQLNWGEYKLTIVDNENKALTSLSFYVGWYGGSGVEETPDTLRVASDKQNYTPGENARLRIEPPFAGEALIAIATDRIVATYPVKVPAGGTTFEVPIKAEWGAGAYALVTAWRPLSTPADRTPTRAIGAVWLGVDPALRTLGVQIGAPEKVTPRQRIEVPDQGRQPAERGGVRHPRRRRRGHPAAHAFQAAQSCRLLLRQAQAGRRHARRLRPPARRQCRRSRPHPDRRRFGRHRRPRRRADPHRRAVQRTGEARRQGRGQDRARHPRLHRPAQDNDRGLRQDARRLGRAAHVRARRGDRRRGPAALPGAQRPRPRGAVAAQCRRPGRRLSLDPGGDGRGRARPAGRRDTQAGGEPARAPDLGSQGGRRRLRQGRRLGRRAGQLRGAPRMGHPGALGPDADRGGHRLAARSAARAHGRPQPDGQLSRPAPRW